MRFPEYDAHDALGLAELVRRKDLAPIELVEAAIERIERRDPSLNAVVHRLYDEGRAAAARAARSAPFAGVPFLLKDLGLAYAGAPLGNGSRFYRGFRPAHHAELVRRYLAAGLIVLGKTNTPELGLRPVTEPEASGPTRNPWDLTRTAGGSSGGSAAAVAARMVPMASGGDGGGSIRIPASCCGLFGFKPSRGRTPVGPDAVEPWQGFSVSHALTVTVRDSAALLDATQGPEPGAVHRAPPPLRPFLEEVTAEPGRLRIAWSAEPYLSPAPVAPECRAAVEDAARLLADLGHELVEARPALDAAAFGRALLLMLAGEVAADIAQAERDVGRRARAADFEAQTWLLRAVGRSITAGEHVAAVRALKTTGRHVETFMAEGRFDALLSPTLAAPPLPLGALEPRGVERLAQQLLGRLGLGRLALALQPAEGAVAAVLAFMPFTPVFNAGGQPSMSVPLYWTAGNLPIGVMLTARYGEDGLLFRLAGQLERARPWRDRRPPLAG